MLVFLGHTEIAWVGGNLGGYWVGTKGLESLKRLLVPRLEPSFIFSPLLSDDCSDIFLPLPLLQQCASGGQFLA